MLQRRAADCLGLQLAHPNLLESTSSTHPSPLLVVGLLSALICVLSANLSHVERVGSLGGNELDC